MAWKTGIMIRLRFCFLCSNSTCGESSFLLKSLDSNGVSSSLSESLLVSMSLLEYLWVFWSLYESQWVSWSIYESFEVSMSLLEYLWVFWSLYEFWWVFWSLYESRSVSWSLFCRISKTFNSILFRIQIQSCFKPWIPLCIL